MKKLITLTAALFSLAVANLQAVPIYGEIHFHGYATLDDNPSAAESIDFANPIDVVEQISTGHYSGFDSTTIASFTDFTFGAVGTTGVLAVNPLWSVDFGGVLYTFELTSLTHNAMSGSQRLLEGWGIARINDGLGTYEATSGFWSLSTSGGSSSVSFSSASLVPDAGTSATLVGLGLLAIGMIARRRANA